MIDVSEIIRELQQSWKNGDATDANFNSVCRAGINAAMEKISHYYDWWFMQERGIVTTIPGQWEYRLGCPPPAAGCTAAIGGVGVLVGNYSYCYTYVNAFGESNPSPLSNVVTTLAQSVNLTNLAAPPVEQAVTAINIYRNTIANQVIWQFAGTIFPAPAIFNDNTADGGLTNTVPYANIPKPFDYAYEIVSPWKLARVPDKYFRSVIPVPTATGPPRYIILFGDKILCYPIPNTALDIYYPYKYYHRRLYYDNDQGPQEVPADALRAGAEYLRILKYLNAEKSLVNYSRDEFNDYLVTLRKAHIRQLPKLKVVDETEGELHRTDIFPTATELDTFN